MDIRGKMDIEIYHAEMLDIPWLREQTELFSNFMGHEKKQLYPGDLRATQALTDLINKQVVFMAKYLDPVETENIKKAMEKGEDSTKKKMEDPWIRTGFIAGILSPHFLNPDITLFSELFWWVPEEYRGGRSGLMLFNMFLEFGVEHADQVIVTLQEESPVNPRILTKRGFKVKEHAYILEV